MKIEKTYIKTAQRLLYHPIDWEGTDEMLPFCVCMASLNKIAKKTLGDKIKITYTTYPKKGSKLAKVRSSTPGIIEVDGHWHILTTWQANALSHYNLTQFYLTIEEV